MRGTWVEALDMGGLGGPKRIIYSMLGQAVIDNLLLNNQQWIIHY
jgi:hypothetical protein